MATDGILNTFDRKLIPRLETILLPMPQERETSSSAGGRVLPPVSTPSAQPPLSQFHPRVRHLLPIPTTNTSPFAIGGTSDEVEGYAGHVDQRLGRQRPIHLDCGTHLERRSVLGRISDVDPRRMMGLRSRFQVSLGPDPLCQLPAARHPVGPVVTHAVLESGRISPGEVWSRI